MRTTNEIIIAVKDCEPVTEEELRLALLSLQGINYFVQNELQKLVDVIREEKPQSWLKMKADFASGTIERMFTALKTPVDKWLGPGNTPGTDEYKTRNEFHKKIYEAATGKKL